MKTFELLNYIVIGLEVLDDGEILSSIAPRQEKGSFVCKHRRTEESKTKVCILFIKYLQTAFLKTT